MITENELLSRLVELERKCEGTQWYWSHRNGLHESYVNSVSLEGSHQPVTVRFTSREASEFICLCRDYIKLMSQAKVKV